MPKLLNDRLRRSNGRELPLTELPSALREQVTSLGPAAVGAHQISCSDESEMENLSAFHQQFVRHLLPPLKHFGQSAFRTLTLGGRYEPGSLMIAENHYATPASEDAFKVHVTKINSHVACAGGPEGRVYGKMARYEQESVWCGALSAMLDGVDLPATRELAETFGEERLAALRDPAQTDPSSVALRMAIANAALQSDRLCDEIEILEPKSPTIFIVVACVTFNREYEDTELLVKLTWADSRLDEGRCESVGLGTDPLAYNFAYEGPTLVVTESPSPDRPG